MTLTRIISPFLTSAMIIWLSLPGCAGDVPAKDWKTIGFAGISGRAFRAIDLDLSVPAEYEVRTGPQELTEAAIGTRKDLDRIYGNGKPRFDGLARGVFRIFPSLAVAYSASSDKFSGEDDAPETLKRAGLTRIELQRKRIGAYPAWIQKGESGGKPVMGCYIATLNSTNVITILFHPPETLKGDEERLFSNFVDSIRQPEFKPAEVRGGDSSEVIRRMLATAARKSEAVQETRITSQYTVGAGNIQKRPTIRQEVIIREKSGIYLSSTFNFTASNELAKDGDTLLFGPPWNTPARSGGSRIDGGDLVSEAVQDGRKLRTIRMKTADLVSDDPTCFLFLSGSEHVTNATYGQLLARTTEIFDLKLTSDGNPIILMGTPDKQRFSRIIPREILDSLPNPDAYLVNAMRQSALITLKLDPTTFEVIEIRVNGTINNHPFDQKSTISRSASTE